MMQFDPTTQEMTEQLATVLVDNLQPVVSPDGRWAAFTSTTTARANLVAQPADGRETRF